MITCSLPSRFGLALDIDDRLEHVGRTPIAPAAQARRVSDQGLHHAYVIDALLEVVLSSHRPRTSTMSWRAWPPVPPVPPVSVPDLPSVPPAPDLPKLP